MSATATKPSVNHGNNILIKRLSRREKQDTVAKAIWGDKATHQKVQRLEQQETIDDATLELFAKYFGCTLEELRDTELMLDAVSVINNNNTLHNSNNAYFGSGDQNITINNSEELMLKLVEEKDKEMEALAGCYERIIKLEEQQKEELRKLLAKK